MKRGFKLIELEGIKTYSLKERQSKVTANEFGRVYTKGSSISQFLETLPEILAARDLKEVASKIVTAYHAGRVIIFGMGGHVIKVGLSPIIIDLMKKGIISAVALNGAGVIHDAEIAMVGHTSEDVGNTLTEGTFGMAEETALFINGAVSEGAEHDLGMGESIGRKLLDADFPYNDLSIVASGAKLKIPVTVHVAMGTDIVHMHPSCNGAHVGTTSHTDFRVFSSIVSRMDKGVYMNIGSAVILPEVFLKAVTLVRNLGFEAKDFTTVNMDFIQQYRPLTNVVRRPNFEGGKGYALTGHHEIMVPLLAAAVLEGLGV